eukprot:tig00021036_g17368.t1
MSYEDMRTVLIREYANVYNPQTLMKQRIFNEGMKLATKSMLIPADIKDYKQRTVETRALLQLEHVMPDAVLVYEMTEALISNIDLFDLAEKAAREHKEDPDQWAEYIAKRVSTSKFSRRVQAVNSLNVPKNGVPLHGRIHNIQFGTGANSLPIGINGGTDDVNSGNSAPVQANAGVQVSSTPATVDPVIFHQMVEARAAAIAAVHEKRSERDRDRRTDRRSDSEDDRDDRRRKYRKDDRDRRRDDRDDRDDRDRKDDRKNKRVDASGAHCLFCGFKGHFMNECKKFAATKLTSTPQADINLVTYGRMLPAAPEVSRQHFNAMGGGAYRGNDVPPYASAPGVDAERPFCNHCRKYGHTVDNCWKLHGHPCDRKMAYPGQGYLAITNGERGDEQAMGQRIPRQRGGARLARGRGGRPTSANDVPVRRQRVVYQAQPVDEDEIVDLEDDEDEEEQQPQRQRQRQPFRGAAGVRR